MRGKPVLQKDGTVTWLSNCVECTRPSKVEGLQLDAVIAWQQGEFIQNAFPRLSADDREIMISGTHPTCWDKMFPPEDEDDPHGWMHL